MQDTLDI